MRLVVKIGTSSLTDDTGGLDVVAIGRVCEQVATLRNDGHTVAIVTSAAISAGLPPLGHHGTRPKDLSTLQAAAAVGQSRLMRAYDDAFEAHGLVSGQVLLSPRDFFERSQYVHARQTVERMLALGVVPIVNENDAVCDDEIRWGDNDRLAALVAHAIRAELLVILTDTDGLFTADPRKSAEASLVTEVTELDEQLNAAAGGPGSARGSGGMASKLVAASMASRAGIRAVIANASRPDVLTGAVAGQSVGTAFVASEKRLPARKLWIAYALAGTGRVRIDDGARSALVDAGKSLLPAGVVAVDRDFAAGDGVEIVDTRGTLVAKGVARMASTHVATERSAGELVHRDDIVVLA